MPHKAPPHLLLSNLTPNTLWVLYSSYSEFGVLNLCQAPFSPETLHMLILQSGKPLPSLFIFWALAQVNLPMELS